MKLNIKTIYIGILLLIAITGCSKDDVTEEEKNYGFIKAKVDGQDRTLSVLYSTFDSDFNDNQIVYAYADEIGITLSFPKAAGTYDFVDNTITGKLSFGSPFDFFDQNNDGPVIDYVAFEGYINVNSINSEQANGDFQFSAKNFDGSVKGVFNGEFEAYKDLK